MAISYEQELLESLLPQWHSLLQGWSADGSLVAAAQESLLLNGTPQPLTDLVTQWSAGDFSSLPPIVLLSSTDISGAMGAYAISTGTIYLNQDWLRTATQDQVFAVLTEELGHSLDALLNAVDTPGDEGEYFSRVLKGETLSQDQQLALREQEDKLTVDTDRECIDAEAAAVDITNSVGVNKDAAVQNSLINLISVDHGWGSAWSKQLIDPSKDWSTSFTFQAEGGSGTSDGYTFVINGDPRGLSAIGDGGGNMGFFGWDTGTGGGVRNSYAITFRMWYNAGPASVIGFSASSDTADTSNYQQSPIALANNSYTTQISYSASTKILSATVGGQIFTQSVDLSSAVGKSAYLGFTAANGGGTMDMNVSYWDINASSYAPAPVIRGNSLYVLVNGPSWTTARSHALNNGGDLVTVNDALENLFLTSAFGSVQSDGIWIGLTDLNIDGNWEWADGSTSTYRNWRPGEPNGNNSTWYEVYTALRSDWGGQWNDWRDASPQPIQYGIAEIPLSLTTTLPTTIKEGAGEFTVNIDLSAGTTSQKHSLIQGARVWYVISGIDSSDLETGYSLQGSGAIDENGNIVVDGATNAGIKLALKNDGAAETDTLGITFYSADPTTTTEALADAQIGTEATQIVTEVTTITDPSAGANIWCGTSQNDFLAGFTNVNSPIPDIIDGKEGFDILNIDADLAETKFYVNSQGINSIEVNGQRAVLLNIERVAFRNGDVNLTNVNLGSVVIDPSWGSNVWSGTSVNDQLIWHAVVNSPIPDIIDGKEGFDILNIDADLAETKFYVNSQGINSIEVNGQRAVLLNIERVAFRNGDVNLTNVNLGSVVIDPSWGSNVWSGTSVNDQLIWHAVVNSPIPDIIDGKEGFDILNIDADLAETKFYVNSQGINSIEVNGQRAVLLNIERVAFRNGDVNLTNANLGSVVIDPSWGSNVWSGTSVNDQLIWHAVVNSPIPDIIDGKEGFDILNIDADLAEAKLYKSPDGEDVLEVNGQIGLLTNIERIAFRDGVVALINSAPVDISLDPSIIPENCTAATLIGTLSATDPDADSTFTYALAAGNGTNDADNNLVAISGNQVLVKSGAVIDYETNPVLNINVQVTDNGGLTYTKALTASVLDTNEAPTNLTLTSSGITENSTGGTVIGTLSATDPDANSTFTYALAAGNGTTDADNSLVTINGNQVLVKSGAVIDYETNPVLNINVQAKDNGGLTYTKALTANVIDVVNEDVTAPTITDISVQGSSVILTFSEKVNSTGINNSTFTVKVGGTARTVSATNYDSTNQNKVTLTLSGTAPTSGQSLQISYSGTSPNTVKDLAGNSLGSITNRSADTFLSGASVTSLYADYSNLTLTGTSAINGTGNAKNNTIIGNEAKNTLNGAAGADVLTGAGGTDTFVFTTLTNSLLGSPTNYTFDRITDFTIGQDRIDGPKTASTSQVQELGTVATLDQAGLQAILTTTRFTANGAATFTYNDNGNLRTFVALNNNVAGFDVTKDAVVEITGYSGLLTNLAIV